MENFVNRNVSKFLLYVDCRSFMNPNRNSTFIFFLFLRDALFQSETRQYDLSFPRLQSRICTDETFFRSFQDIVEILTIHLRHILLFRVSILARAGISVWPPNISPMELTTKLRSEILTSREKFWVMVAINIIPNLFSMIRR
jgi:hypothetical protein